MGGKDSCFDNFVIRDTCLGSFYDISLKNHKMWLVGLGGTEILSTLGDLSSKDNALRQYKEGTKEEIAKSDRWKRNGNKKGQHDPLG